MIDTDEKARRFLDTFMDKDHGNATWLLAAFLRGVIDVPKQQAVSLDMREMGRSLRTLMDNGYKT